MSEETQTAETSQSRYNTRKRKLSEDIQEKENNVEKAEDKKLKIKVDYKEEEDDVEEDNVEEDDVEEVEVEKKEEEVKDDGENNIESNAVTAKVIEKIETRGRKRKLSEEKDVKSKPETSRKRKDIEKEEDEEVDAKKRRVTKSECYCAPVTQKPDYSQDKDAEITVADWRLQSVQSPIELKHSDSNEYDHFDPLEFHGHWDSEGVATVKNNGYTATLTFENREVPYLLGGPLHEDTFIFEQLHFHWSDGDHSGCEHIFEGKAYSMEAHAVHYNSKYESFKVAADKYDGLAVVAFFLQATDDFENQCFKKLSEAVKDIGKINSSTEVRPDCLTWIKEAAQCKGYYTYQGSLTTEPYFESVTWIIYPKPIHISREQVQNFRNMKSTECEKHNIVNNVRPIQTPQKKLDILFARSHKVSERMV